MIAATALVVSLVMAPDAPPGERVSAEEALRMFSADVAYAAFEEVDRGAIAVGRRADFTVLSQDLTAGPPPAILGTQVDMTVVGGRIVYEGRPRD